MNRKGNYKHGGCLQHSKLYRVWNAMRDRCYRTSDKHYADYGGRGIVICPEWQTFPPFLSWALSAGYAPGLSIERVNNDGPYSPDNCRWIPFRNQARNKRNSKLSLEKAEAIRRAYVPGVTRQVDLATQFGVVQTTVSSVLRGRIWT